MGTWGEVIMAGTFNLVHTQTFTSTDTIQVTHNSGYEYVKVKVIINNDSRVDLIRNIVTDVSDPTNKLTIYLTSAQTGVIQVLKTDFVSPGELSSTGEHVVVYATGDQTISGSKTFIDPVVSVYPIQDYHLTTKYYVDTVSGMLQTQIDAKQSTLLELTDTPSTYDNSKWLQSTATGTFWADVAGISGPKGEDGGEWVGGYGAPTASTGALNNFYIDYSNGDVYRKESTTSGGQYGVMVARESDGSYTFADAVRFVKTGREIIVDNVDAEAVFTGTWYTYNTANAWAGNCRYATSDHTAQANFKFTVPEDGDYDVYAYWPALGAAAANVPFMITHASGTTTIRKSQTIDGSTWNYLSTHKFDGAATWVWKMNIQGSTTFSGLSDTPPTYDNGKYLRSTAVGTEWYDLNDDYYTELEVDTISGSLQAEINTHMSDTNNPHSVTLEQARIAGNTISSNNMIYFRDVNSAIYSSAANILTLGATNEVVVERDLHVDRDLYVDHSFTIDGGVAVNIIRDEDDFGHDDPNALVTQQSAKAYIDAKPDTLLELTDTPSSYSNNSYLRSTTSGAEWVSINQIIQCYNSAVTNLNVTTPVAVPWNNEDFKDSLFTHSNVTNNTRVQVTATGIYEISYNISLDNESFNRNTVRTRIRVNGSTYINRGTATSYSRNATDDKQSNSSGSFSWPLKANDYIEVVGDGQGSSGIGNTIANESHIYIKLIRYI
jgi:hypothetical protein